MIGALIYYIAMSKEKKIAIAVSAVAVVAELLVTFARAYNIIYGKSQHITMSSRWNAMWKHKMIPTHVVSGGMFLAAAIIFVALLITFIKTKPIVQHKKEEINYTTPNYTAPVNGTERSERGNGMENDEIMKVVKPAICNQLKSPASAQFPAELLSIIGDDERGYQVSGFVDSQNSYGAMIRNDFTANVVIENGFLVVKSASVGKKANAARAKQFGVNYIVISICTIIIAAVFYFIMKSAIGF